MARLRTAGPLAAFAVLVMLLGVFSAGALGYRTGQRAGEATGLSVSQSASQVEAKILAVIVRRNPGATVREFLRFPNQLMTEAERLNLDFRYVMAIVDRESNWHPQAVSPKGAIGLMQIMPDTARLVVDKLKLTGFDAPVPARGGGYVSLGSLGEPEFNLRVGMQFLRWQLDDFGLGPVALRAYNRGPAKATERWPGDTYSADVAQRLLVLVHEVR
ncbi:MAG: transglycosylase SLT domain-containing protein [Deltaproteobacteria bacterium]|nr:transglycosylase SLT domain-containing protein [Deltaproteobacteria bacterium]